MRVDGAQGAPNGTIAQHDRGGEIAAKAVHFRSRMVAKRIVGFGVIDDDGFAVLPDLAADRGFDAELTTFFHTEIDAVANGATHPAIRCYARNRNESHACDLANGVQDFGNGVDLLDSFDVRVAIGRHDRTRITSILSLTPGPTERSPEQSYGRRVSWTWAGANVSKLSHNKAAILVVEDDFLIRANAIDMVRELGFEAIEAVDADHAISLLEAYPDLPISVVFTDIQMPGSMDGLRLAAVIRHRRPPVALLVTSGQVDPPAQELPSGARFLPKPYLLHHLKTHL